MRLWEVGAARAMVGGASRTGDGGRDGRIKKLCQRYEPYRLVTLAKYIGFLIFNELLHRIAFQKHLVGVASFYRFVYR